MGKASKWIINFLFGKKEYRKRSETSLSVEFKSTKSESEPITPKVKRKWSFRKLAGKNGSRKFSKSFDSIEPTKLLTQVTAEEPVALRNHVKAFVAIRGKIESVAATKIQSVFRSYLAKRALHALRGLVKLQALVRGHIVRKQTASTLKRMHALMSIQVRARFQRIQMADETQLVVKSRSSMDDTFIHDHKKAVNFVSKSSSGHLNRSQIERINTEVYSDQISPENSPRSYEPLSYGYPLLPNYMINTKSSRAKVRSQSEPKQRPKWNTRQRDKQSEIVSLDDSDVKRSSSHHKFDTCDNPDPWFFKLYKAERSSRNDKCDSVPNPISHSNYYESFADYEPNFNLY